MLMQWSWLLFWTSADKHKLMKMMIISMLNIVMELMMIQLKKKKIILTNYHNTKV